jgi:hypothetical protein
VKKAPPWEVCKHTEEDHRRWRKAHPDARAGTHPQIDALLRWSMSKGALIAPIDDARSGLQVIFADRASGLAERLFAALRRLDGRACHHLDGRVFIVACPTCQKPMRLLVHDRIASAPMPDLGPLRGRTIKSIYSGERK